MSCINKGTEPWASKPNPLEPVSCATPPDSPVPPCSDITPSPGPFGPGCPGWEVGPNDCPAPPINAEVISPLFAGTLDLRWDNPAILAKNGIFTVLGVNIYRSDTSERGPYTRLNIAPVGGSFYRDFTDNAFVESEVVDWETSWLSRGEQANDRKWVFRTQNLPIVKNSGQAVGANSPMDVQLVIDNQIIPVHAVFGPTGEITLINVRGYNFATERWIEPTLPTGPETAVSISYRYNKNTVKTNLDRKTWYRITTVAQDPASPSGFRETPLDFTEAITYLAVERIDYIWREAMRRNNWILEQGGERVKLFVKKTSGAPCWCRRDPKTLEYMQQPSSRCEECFPPGTEITMGDFTRKPIEEIQVGDEILTHTGQMRRVYETMSRDVEECLVEIKATHGVGFSPTRNHPVLIVRQEDARCIRHKNSVCTGPGSKKICTRKPWTDPCSYTVEDKAQWVRADEVREGDYLVFCPPVEELSTNGMSRERLRTLGYYAAEGWTAKKKRKDGSWTEDQKNTWFGFHVDERPTYIAELQEYLREEYGAASSVQPCSNTEKGCSLAVSKQAVAKDMLAHVGKYSRRKRLSTELVRQHSEGSLQFLGAYFNGDGWQCLNESRTHLGVSTASYDMARQVEVMLLRQHIVPRFDMRHRMGVPNPGRPGTHDTTEHTVAIRKTDMHVLASTMNMENVTPKVRRSGWAVAVGSLVLYPIKSVQHVPYKGKVYNLEVEEDHSYVANGAVAHNCFGTGFLGGFEGPYDMIIAPDDADRAVKQSPNGRFLDHTQDVFTGPSPLLTMRDLIVKQTNERYSIGPVRKPSNRGNIMQQHFQMKYLDENDIRYTIPLFDTTELCWPECRGRPAVMQGGGWATESPPQGPFPVGADYQQTPMQTEKDNIPDEREQRGRTPAWENIQY